MSLCRSVRHNQSSCFVAEHAVNQEEVYSDIFIPLCLIIFMDLRIQAVGTSLILPS
jgi:hypothetical protein